MTPSPSRHTLHTGQPPPESHQTERSATVFGFRAQNMRIGQSTNQNVRRKLVRNPIDIDQQKIESESDVSLALNN